MRYLTIAALAVLAGCARHPPVPDQAAELQRARETYVMPNRPPPALPAREQSAGAAEVPVHEQTLIQKNAAAYAGSYEKASRWETVEADNGAIYKVDIGHVEAVGRGVSTRVIKDEAGDITPYGITFDCAGHYFTSGTAWQYAPPRSVIGRIAALACAKADRTAQDR